jgi:GNAT superfamily N-acetyltransferase
MTVREIRLEAARAMTRRHGDGPWSRVQGLPTLRKHQAERAIVLVETDSTAAATFTLGRKKPPFYRGHWFANPKAPAVFLSNMAVIPQLQRRGIGRWCMHQAERLAGEWGAQCIRLDAFQGPAGAGTFYEKCGYTLAHSGTLGLEYYEKVLD